MEIQIVTESNAIRSDTQTFSYISFASNLGISPGKVPAKLETTLGNKRPLQFIQVDKDGSMHYFQELGCTGLRIFND